MQNPLREPWWRSGESACLPPMWPGFNSRRRRHTLYVGWVCCWFSPFAPRGFSPGTPVFPSPQKPTLPNSNLIWNARTRLNKFIWTPMCFMGKQAIYIFFFLLYHFLQLCIAKTAELLCWLWRIIFWMNNTIHYYNVCGWECFIGS